MSRPPGHDILFEPVRIGRFTAKNRFYQVPHCNGGGYRDPSAAAAMRAVKAEGGWGVIFTEQVEMHHSSEITPFIELRLWEEKDLPGLARMAAAMKTHGALAGIQLAYPAVNGPNLYTREVPMAVTGMPVRAFINDPVSARTMDREDIRALRRWHVTAAERAARAGFDLLCLYGAHGFGVLQHFLSRVTNHRDDEYGGSLENRGRFLRELVADIRDRLGDGVALTLRLSLEEMGGEGFSNAELRDFIEMHGDLPDLWDLAHGAWEDCSGPSRFREEGAQEPLVAGIRDLTPKPVVGVGRFTSPDAMARQVRAGVLDFIGCARPSIADPFLPLKVEEGRAEDIRECIGCNICISGDMTMSLSRCTQNPTFMEEWRKGWHPEIMNPKGPSERVLVVGAGPAGLEAARALGLRGYDVAMAEATRELGGRVARERLLPGLAAWGRVADYRVFQIGKLPNVEVYRESRLNAEEVLEFGFEHVCLATGSHWRRDGASRFHVRPIPLDPALPVLTPDDLMAGAAPPSGEVVIYDDDHYYMGGVLAELCATAGARVTLVTPAPLISHWTVNTLEQGAIHRRLAALGVRLVTQRAVVAGRAGLVETECAVTGARAEMAADALVLVTAREPEDALWRALKARRADWADAGIASVRVIGDAEAPTPIAWATYAGHRYARELDAADPGDKLPFRREIADLAADWEPRR